MPGHVATPEQRKRAVVTGVVLALVAASVYAVVVFKFFAA
jgi:hypothetical protein